MSNKNNRNDPCTCGSGKKYKKCCGFRAASDQQFRRRAGRFGAIMADASSSGGLKNHVFKKTVQVMKKPELAIENPALD